MPERECKTTWRLLCKAAEQRLVYRLQEQENKFVAAQRQFEASNIVSGEDCASLKHFLITYRAQRTSCWASQELARAAPKQIVPPMKMGGALMCWPTDEHRRLVWYKQQLLWENWNKNMRKNSDDDCNGQKCSFNIEEWNWNSVLSGNNLNSPHFAFFSAVRVFQTVNNFQ